MEDINNKAFDDELNKAQDSIEETPRQKIEVPKPHKTESHESDSDE